MNGSSLEKEKMEERFTKMAEAVDGNKTKEEDRVPTTKMESVYFRSPPTGLSNDNETSPKTYITSKF